MLRITKLGFAKALIRTSGRLQVGGVVNLVDRDDFLYVYSVFPNAEMSEFDTSLETQFTNEIVTNVATVAEVDQADVTVEGYSAGSIIATIKINFKTAGTAKKTTFQSLVSNTPGALYASSTLLSSYGTVTSYFSVEALPAPVTTENPDGSSTTVRTTADGTVTNVNALDGSFVSETTVSVDDNTGNTTTVLIDDTLTTTTTVNTTTSDVTLSVTTMYPIDLVNNSQTTIIDDYPSNTRDTTIN